MAVLKDKVALITGAGSGIGKALAFNLAAQGAKIVLNGRRIEKLREVEAELHKMGYQQVALAPGDVSVYEECEHIIGDTIAAFGQLDILVNNAALVMEGEIELLHPDVFKTVMNVNYLGCVYPSKAALHWLKQTKGSIFFISGVAGMYGMAKHSVYSSSKMALTALAQSLRIELKGTGVHVGIIYVGFTQHDTGKTQYVASGQLAAISDRHASMRVPTTVVAKHISKAIKTRKKSYNYTLSGKLLVIVQFFAPWLVELLLTKEYNSRQTKPDS